MKFILLLLSLIMNGTGQAQDPDIISIHFPDTVRTHTDCILKISLLKSDNEEFLFPEKYRVGEDDGESDLTIIIEKFDGNTFSYYRCNKSPFSVPILDTHSVIFTRQKAVQINDSLESLVCIEQGYFRMRVEYRAADGSPILKTRFISKSNWVKFYVDKPKIILSSYARERLGRR